MASSIRPWERTRRHAARRLPISRAKGGVDARLVGGVGRLVDPPHEVERPVQKALSRVLGLAVGV